MKAREKAPLKIALFIPAYNVEDSVVEVLRAIPPEDFRVFHQIFVFDNQSTDRTFERLAGYQDETQDARIRLFRNKANYRLGGSSVLAFDKAIQSGCDYLICLHSDGQADPKDLRKFIDACDGQNDLVLGSRLGRGSAVRGYSKLRLLGNRVFSEIQKKILGVSADDLGAFLAFNLKTIGAFPYDRIAPDMGYHPLLIMGLFKKNGRLRYREFPISWGEVRSSNVNIWVYGLKHLLRLAQLGLGRIPLRSKRPDLFTVERKPKCTS